MSALPKPWEMDAHTRRRRVRALLIQAAVWAPTMGENQGPSQSTSTQGTSCRQRSQ